MWRAEHFQRQKDPRADPPHAELPPREPDVRAWGDVPPGEQWLAAPVMEVFAGFLSTTDHHVGRVIDFVEQIGELDDTIVVVLSDDGARAEGSAHGTVHEALLLEGIEQMPIEGVSFAQRATWAGGWSAICRPARHRYGYRPGTMVPVTEAADVKNRSQRTTASVQRAPGDGGVLAFDVTRTGEHRRVGRLLADGEVVAQREVPDTLPVRYGVGSGPPRIGDDAGISVTARDEPPFASGASMW